MDLLVSGTKETVTFEDALVNEEFKEGLIHQLVTSYLNNARSGTKAQKTRSEVSGGGKKPWKQKGTGRARAGTIRSPIWRAGGVTFAAKPKVYQHKVNKKEYKLGIRSMISELLRQERLELISELSMEKTSTKLFKENFAKHIDGKTLFITPELSEEVYLSSRNLINVEVIDVFEVNPYDLVAYDKIVITVDALKHLEGKLI
jgi:large subunit ribosomal protein L4